MHCLCQVQGQNNSPHFELAVFRQRALPTLGIRACNLPCHGPCSAATAAVSTFEGMNLRQNGAFRHASSPWPDIEGATHLLRTAVDAFRVGAWKSEAWPS